MITVSQYRKQPFNPLVSFVWFFTRPNQVHYRHLLIHTFIARPILERLQAHLYCVIEPTLFGVLNHLGPEVL